MDENTDTTGASEAPVEKKQNFVKRFVTNHPRLSKVAGVTAAIGTVVGLVAVAGARKSEPTLDQDPESPEEFNLTQETPADAEA